MIETNNIKLLIVRHTDGYTKKVNVKEFVRVTVENDFMAKYFFDIEVPNLTKNQCISLLLKHDKNWKILKNYSEN